MVTHGVYRTTSDTMEWNGGMERWNGTTDDTITAIQLEQLSIRTSRKPSLAAVWCSQETSHGQSRSKHGNVEWNGGMEHWNGTEQGRGWTTASLYKSNDLDFISAAIKHNAVVAVSGATLRPPSLTLIDTPPRVSTRTCLLRHTPTSLLAQK